MAADFFLRGGRRLLLPTRGIAGVTSMVSPWETLGPAAAAAAADRSRLLRCCCCKAKRFRFVSQSLDFLILAAVVAAGRDLDKVRRFCFRGGGCFCSRRCFNCCRDCLLRCTTPVAAAAGSEIPLLGPATCCCCCCRRSSACCRASKSLR